MEVADTVYMVMVNDCVIDHAIMTSCGSCYLTPATTEIPYGGKLSREKNLSESVENKICKENLCRWVAGATKRCHAPKFYSENVCE